jgi:hypothetical protein
MEMTVLLQHQHLELVTLMPLVPQIILVSLVLVILDSLEMARLAQMLMSVPTEQQLVISTPRVPTPWEATLVSVKLAIQETERIAPW